MKFQAIKGVRDILPPESALWNRVEQTAREVFGTFGFAEIRLPIFEETRLFARSIGEETDVVSKEMYTFSPPEPEVEHLLGLRSAVLGWPDPWDPLHLGPYRAIVAQFVDLFEHAFAARLVPVDDFNRMAFANLKTHAQEFAQASSTRSMDFARRVQEHSRVLEIGQSISLRPEATASVVRAYIE